MLKESRIRAFAPNTCLGTLRSPLATCSGPGYFTSLKDGDIPAFRTQAAAPAVVGDKVPRLMVGPRPVVAAAGWALGKQSANLLPRPGLAAGKPRGGSARRMCLARPRDGHGRPPHPGPPRAALPLRSGRREQWSSGRAKLEGTRGKPSTTRARGPAECHPPPPTPLPPLR